MTNIQHFVRFQKGQAIGFGQLNGDVISILDGNLFDNPKETGDQIGLADVILLSPVAPQNVFCVGRNYRSHAGDKATPIPGIFTKLPTVISGPNAPIPYPKGAEDLHFEAEMVVVMGRQCFNVTPEQALDYVFGVTCGNDLSERNWQKNDLQWVRAKSSDGFGPIGPVLVTGLNYNDILLEGRLNGEVVQSERTSNMIHSVGNVISFISQTITINPGDIIYTGTPGQTRAVQPGDVIEVELENVGVLKNKVVTIE